MTWGLPAISWALLALMWWSPEMTQEVPVCVMYFWAWSSKGLFHGIFLQSFVKMSIYKISDKTCLVWAIVLQAPRMKGGHVEKRRARSIKGGHVGKRRAEPQLPMTKAAWLQWHWPTTANDQSSLSTVTLTHNCQRPKQLVYSGTDPQLPTTKAACLQWHWPTNSFQVTGFCTPVVML